MNATPKHPETMEMDGNGTFRKPMDPSRDRDALLQLRFTELQDEAFVSNGRRVALQRAAGI